MKNSREEMFWMIDDDISRFNVFKNGKYVKSSFNDMAILAEHDFVNYKFDMMGINYAQFPSEKNHKYPTNAEVCVLVKKGFYQGISYDKEVSLKEDRDLILQALVAGKKVGRCDHYAFNCPSNGSNAGGLQEEYKAKKDRDAVLKMVKKWPRYCEMIIKDSGRWDLKYNWKLAAKDGLSKAAIPTEK